MLQTLSIIHQESYSMHDAWCIIHYTLYGTTDIQPEMLSGVQTGNGTPHDKYDIRGIAHARTNRKDNIFMQRRLVQNFIFILEWGQNTRDLFIDEAHTPLDIFRFAVFFPCMLPRYFSEEWHFKSDVSEMTSCAWQVQTLQYNDTDAGGIFSKNISYWGWFWIIPQILLNISYNYFE